MNKKLTAFVLLVLISFIVYKINTYSEKYSVQKKPLVPTLSEAEKRGCWNEMGDDFCDSIEDKHCKAHCDGCGKRCHGKLKSDDGKKCVCAHRSSKGRGTSSDELGMFGNGKLGAALPKCKISGSEFITKYGNTNPHHIDMLSNALWFRHSFYPDNLDIEYANPLACLPGAKLGRGETDDRSCIGNDEIKESCGILTAARACENDPFGFKFHGYDVNGACEGVAGLGVARLDGNASRCNRERAGGWNFEKMSWLGACKMGLPGEFSQHLSEVAYGLTPHTKVSVKRMGDVFRKQFAGSCTPPDVMGSDHRGYCTGSLHHYYKTRVKNPPKCKDKDPVFCETIDVANCAKFDFCEKCPKTCSGRGVWGRRLRVCARCSE